MTRKRFDIIDVIVALIVGVVLGIFATYCFSSPSSEARFETLDGVESGFIESNRIRSGSNPAGADCPPSASAFTKNLAQGGWASKPTENGALERARPPIFTVTAYCPKSCCCGEFADGITASGHKIRPGDHFVAAPPEIPFGTLMTIEGYAGGCMVSVEDRGGKIKGNRFDVFIPDHNEALAWGTKHFEVVR